MYDGPGAVQCTPIECDHTDVQHDTREGASICRACGLVLGNIFSTDVETRNPDAARCDFSTREGCSGTFITGNSLMSKINLSLQKYDRVQREETDVIDRICTTLQLGNEVAEVAAQHMSCIRKKTGIWRGARRIALRAACVSIACDQMCVGISDVEIATSPLVSLQIKTMNKQKKLALNLLHDAEVRQSHVRYSSEYGRRFCRRLGFDRYLTSAVCMNAEHFDAKPRLQSKPCNMIVTVSVIDICLRCTKLPTTLSELCNVANVTAPTMAKWYAEATRISFSSARALLRRLRNS